MFQTLCNTGKGLIDIGGILKERFAGLILAGITCCFFVFGYGPVEASFVHPAHTATNTFDIILVDIVAGRNGSVDDEEHLVGEGIVLSSAVSGQAKTVCDEDRNEPACETGEDCYIDYFRKRDHYVRTVAIAFVSGIIGGLMYTFIYWAWTLVKRRRT